METKNMSLQIYSSHDFKRFTGLDFLHLSPQVT